MPHQDQTTQSRRAPYQPSAAPPVPGEVRVFMFKDAVRPQYALSIDPLGGNLPKAGPGPWTFIRVVSLVDREVRPAFDADEALRDVREAGYALITSPFNAD